MSEPDTIVEVVREALPGEMCQDGALIAEDDFIPCPHPAKVVLRITDCGVAAVAEFCAEHADPLLRHAAEHPADDQPIF